MSPEKPVWFSSPITAGMESLFKAIVIIACLILMILSSYDILK